MEPFHGGLATSLVQGIDYPGFKRTPIVEGADPEEVNQRVELFDLVLATVKISGLGILDETQGLTWGCR